MAQFTHANQAYKQSQVVIETLQSSISTATSQREAVKSSVTKQLNARRDALLHSAIDDAIATLNKVS